MNTYEAMILLDNREVKKSWDSLKETVDGVLTRNGAEIVVAKRWDERKLTFEIKKQRRATYYLAFFKAEPRSVADIRHNLKLSGPVLRHMILRCEEIPAMAYEPEQEFSLGDETPAPVADEPEDGTEPSEGSAEEKPTQEGSTEESPEEDARTPDSEKDPGQDTAPGEDAAAESDAQEEQEDRPDTSR